MFIPSLAPLLVGNYTNRRYDQNTDPSSGCLSVGATKSQFNRGTQTRNTLSNVQRVRYVCVSVKAGLLRLRQSLVCE